MPDDGSGHVVTNLVNKTRLLADLAVNAARWVDDHAPEAGNDSLRALRRERRVARKLSHAANRRSAVAVYGASQAGKSYLISSLSAPEHGPLRICYGGESFEFLKEINPTGGDESSGLVSRFTLFPPTPPDGAPPVTVRLLSVADIIRIVGNTFLSDFKLINVTPPPLNTIMEKLGNLPLTEGQTVLDIDDVEALREYFTRKFGDKIWINILDDAYWGWLGQHVGLLAPQDLLRAFSPLWGGVEDLGRYAGVLVEALVTLGQPEMAYCDVKALLPRDKSILNVSTLFKPAGDIEPVYLVGEKGSRAYLPRNVVSAIISELVIPLTSARWSFMDKTDLLDFPGARSRLKIPEVAEAKGKEGTLFLRGKVDYLFDLYQDNMETTATLMCVADSAQEVSDLPAMIKSWIDDTMGATPAQRADKQDALFVILTKFDRQFEEKGGADESSSDGWNTRLQASLINFFKESWVNQWKPGKPFDNVQWLRASSAGSLYTRDDVTRQELEMLPDVAQRVARSRASYLASPVVRKHIHDFERAFDEAIKPNDGGVSYLAERLHDFCEKSVRTEQLTSRLKQCSESILHIITSFYHNASSLNASDEARQSVAKIALALREVHRNRLLGAFFISLEPEREAIIREWNQFNTELDTAPPPPEEDDPLALILGGAMPDPASREDQHDHFAKRIMDMWVKNYLGRMQPEQAARFGMESHVARLFAERMEVLANMLDLRGKMAEALRRNCDHVNRLNISGEKQSVICVELIGRFLTWLGYADEDAISSRPCRINSDEKIFDRPDPCAGLPDLPLKPNVYVDQFFHDWVLALRQRFEESGPQFDVEANEQLGTIINGLDTVKA
ncbi:virulence factor SrfC family protein [Acetobacter fabarum]|uniref:virulence factor SrfC family protein n=1 Tax=Acetobacter fabarum TaxID=483199 RepID=UPI00312B9169